MDSAVLSGVQHPWIMVVFQGVSDPWISEIAIRSPKSMHYGSGSSSDGRRAVRAVYRIHGLGSVVRGSTSMDLAVFQGVSDPWISEIAIRSPESMDCGSVHRGSTSMDW